MPSIELDYAALAIDTSVFMSNGLNFDRGLLRQLDQFKGSPVRLLLSEVVMGELRKHMLERVVEARAKLHSALKATKAQFELPSSSLDVAIIDIIGERTDLQVVEDRLAKFLERTGAEVLSPSNVKVQDLVKCYFAGSAPFEETKDKKSEFPDAIALFSLEAWAEVNDRQVLAVSEDKGWIEFAEQSKYIDGSRDLAKALSYFQPHNAAKEIIESIKSFIEGGADHEVLADVAEMIAETTSEADLEVAFSSSIHAEPDNTEVLYLGHEYVCDKTGRPVVDLVRIEESWLVLRLQVEIDYEVHAWFNMSVWDSVDREYVSLGSSKVKQSASITSDLLLSLTADFSKGLAGVKVGALSLDLDFPIVDVGDLEPNFHDE